MSDYDNIKAIVESRLKDMSNDLENQYPDLHIDFEDGEVTHDNKNRIKIMGSIHIYKRDSDDRIKRININTTI